MTQTLAAPLKAGSRKTLKGAIALAAAGALLAGGYGTYALWTSTVELNGGAVNSGELKLVDPSEGAWADTSTGTPVAIADIAAFNVVPGDTLTYTTTATVKAKGDNLAATLVADPASVTGDTELRQDITVSTVISIDGTTVSAITEDDNDDVVKTVVTFAFTSASLNATQLQSLDLTNLKLTLNQNTR